MSDFDEAVQRLTGWVRDFGDQKPRVFIGDLSIVLLAAKESKRQQEEIENLQSRLAEITDAHRVVMEERCHADERHCTCVPVLRAEVARLSRELEQSSDIYLHAVVSQRDSDCREKDAEIERLRTALHVIADYDQEEDSGDLEDAAVEAIALAKLALHQKTDKETRTMSYPAFLTPYGSDLYRWAMNCPIPTGYVHPIYGVIRENTTAHGCPKTDIGCMTLSLHAEVVDAVLGRLTQLQNFALQPTPR